MSDLIRRQGAIKAVSDLYAIYGSEGEWVDRRDVFNALRKLPSAQPKTEERTTESVQNVSVEGLVSRKAVIEAVDKHTFDTDEGLCLDDDITCILEEIPSAQPEIIRCKDCKYTDGDKPIADGRYWCMLHGTFMYYCSDAERREE